MPGTISIRPAAAGDSQLIVKLIRALAIYEKLEHEVGILDEDVDRHLFGDRPAAEALIAEHDGAAVGFALFFQNFSTWRGRPGLYLEDLFVEPEHRGLGIGKALLVELARIARRRNYARMEWSVLDWNSPSIAFYESLGAVPMSGWTTFRLTDDGLTRLAGQGSLADA
jgi:GNAT superfamily N-acetyltransferase